MSVNPVLPPALDFRDITDQTHVDIIHDRIQGLITALKPFNPHIYVHPKVIAFETGKEQDSWRPDQEEPMKMGAMHEFVKAEKNNAMIRVVVCCTYARGSWVNDCFKMADGSKLYNSKPWHVWGLALVKASGRTSAFIYDDGAEDHIQEYGLFQGAIMGQQLRVISTFQRFGYGNFSYQLAGHHNDEDKACQRHTLQWLQSLLRHGLPADRPAVVDVGYCIGQISGSVAPLNFKPVNINTKSPEKAKAEAEARAALPAKPDVPARRTRSSGLRPEDQQVFTNKGKKALSASEAKRSVYGG